MSRRVACLLVLAGVGCGVPAGNFYTAETLTFPLRIEVQRNGIGVAMSTLAPHGDCNLCHSNPPQNSAPGRIFLPQ